MARRERDVLEDAVRRSEQASNTSKVIDEAMDARLACGMEVHGVQGISMADPGHWGHRFPAPHGEPSS
jgi:hypothetical protein